MFHGTRDDVLHIVSQTLLSAGIGNRFCEGSSQKQVETLSLFTATSDVRVLMLSSLKAAAGANLQVANHVVLLDPPGHNAQHGAALERQAIGRSVRVGQDKPVLVTRFIVEGTIEADLFRQNSAAIAQQNSANAVDESYVCDALEEAAADVADVAAVAAADRGAGVSQAKGGADAGPRPGKARKTDAQKGSYAGATPAQAAERAPSMFDKRCGRELVSCAVAWGGGCSSGCNSVRGRPLNTPAVYRVNRAAPLCGRRSNCQPDAQNVQLLVGMGFIESDCVTALECTPPPPPPHTHAPLTPLIV